LRRHFACASCALLVFVFTFRLHQLVTMAGPIRQPIDLNKLQSYIEKHVPEIKTPLDVKQV
jgi:hypothetical protein